MKKLKNKLFYINAFFLYLILVFVVSILALMFIDASSKSFLINNFAANKNGSFDIWEVIIDDYSIQEYEWPWTKDKFMDILDYFHKYAEPKVIGLDMHMKSFDENNPTDLKYLKQISKMDNLVLGFIPEILVNNSGETFLNDFKKSYSLDITQDSVSFPKYYNGVVNSSDKILDATKNFGSVKIEDSAKSGYIFSATNFLRIDDGYYPSLPLKMFMLANSTNKISLNDDFALLPDTGLKIPYNIKSNGTAQTDIHFYQNLKLGDIATDYSHPNVSASKILDTYYALNKGITPEVAPEAYKSGKYVNPEYFKDKIVFIGQNISGPSGDVLKTPMAVRHPGVDVQATVYDNFANSYFLRHSGFLISLLAFIFLSLFAFVVILRFKFFKGLLSIIAFDILFMLYVFFMAYKGTIVSYSVPLSCQFVTIVFGYSFKFITENRNKEKIKQAMGKYLSQDVMRNVVSNIDDLKLGGKRAIVTVLFSDIRGFTSLSEKMSAEEVSVILNEYFAEMEPIISKYNGIINKFIGDAVMAIFGEPIQDINHAQNAVKCAYEMLKKVEYLREKWLFEGKPKIEIGVGINTGEVFIGNIGTETRMEYTVIGDTVNLASRIESYNKVYKTNLLVSSSTYSHISDIADVIKISEVQIRGKAKKMNIYEVLRIDRNG